MAQIKRLAKGQTPTPLEERYFNDIVDLLNALQTIQVNPAGAGTFQIGARNAILDLSALINRIQALETQAAQSDDKLKQALAGASARANCNPDGSVTVTFSFPGI